MSKIVWKICPPISEFTEEMRNKMHFVKSTAHKHNFTVAYIGEMYRGEHRGEPCWMVSCATCASNWRDDAVLDFEPTHYAEVNLAEFDLIS